MLKTHLSGWTLLLSTLSACLLVACGGGGDDHSSTLPPTAKGSFTAVVSFGDSLSDIGTYAPATSATGDGQPPFIGGKFTTNGPTGTVWVENLAAALGIVVTPAEVGFDGRSVTCPAAGSPIASSCTAYGQGGARVTDPDGIGHNEDGTGALTVPVTKQIANHLQRFGGFKDSDLVFVYAGNNDVLIQFAFYLLAAEQAQADAASGVITQAQAAQQITAAQLAAEQAVKQVAQALATDVVTNILGHGGKYVAVMTLSDIGDTPLGNTEIPPSTKPELTQLSVLFNQVLRDGLNNQPVRIIDTFTIFKDAYTHPATYGFVNNTTPACDVDKISAITGGQVDDGSSLFCNATPGVPYNGLTPGASATTWQFADDIHPTTGGHKVISDAFTAQIRSFGWI